ncbi:sulfatase [Algibacter miyuki]|uniref:Sulfatase n=1 Tax=Algibacter miyuki TaxID=1306933 RepID=A0ABV5H6D3_9FLAO|nr:sulfatase [Algibacter miyuki]MDN3663982.1 sulfatase [Algibacter miyuki]
MKFISQIILSFCFFTSILSHSQEKKPNLVIIIADDHGVYHSSPYGSTGIKTPHIQKLSDEGIRFDNAYVASPACGPSRAALFTGMMPYNNGIVGNHEFPLKPGVSSLVPKLIEQGYQVVFQGKVAHGKKKHHQDYVPDEVTVLDSGLKSDLKLSILENFLKTRKDKRPIALFVGFTDTHRPYPSLKNTKVRTENVVINKRIYSTPEAKLEMSRYLQAVENLDSKLGTVRKMTKHYLKNDNTVTLFTSDHGMAWPFGKWSLYETGIRCPLIVSWPGKIAPNTTTSAMVSWIDIIPTIIDIMDGEIPTNIDGKSFANVLYGKEKKHREVIYATHKGDKQMNVYPIRSVRVDNWKYIRNLHPEFAYTTHTDVLSKNKIKAKSSAPHWASYLEAAKTDPAAADFLKDYHSNPAEELYNLEQDPLEQNNLAALSKYSKKLKSLRKMISKRMIEVGDDESLSGPPKLLEISLSWSPQSKNNR